MELNSPEGARLLESVRSSRDRGDYAAAESQLVALLDSLPEDSSQSLRQELAQILIEQGKYSLALQALKRAETWAATQDAFAQGVLDFNFVRLWTLLGEFERATERLAQARPKLAKGGEGIQAYASLFEAKIAYGRGATGAALRGYEQAARQFEQQGDSGGKFEVLLGMSAVLLENRMVAASERMIRLLAEWKEIANYPAFEQAFRLRRLVLGAYTGKWSDEDLALIGSEPYPQGRIEDWLQFWFHLALAAQTLKDAEIFSLFLEKAKTLVETLQRNIVAEHQPAFLRRADVARILRLGSPQSEAKTSPRIFAEDEADSVADAAMLPPPRNS